MSGRLGIDFGTSNTVLALWDAHQRRPVPFKIPEYSLLFQQADESVPVIPSLVHYTEDGRIWIGNQVVNRGLANSPRTMRWMKRYISHRSPIRFEMDGKEITPHSAGQDFLTAVLVSAGQEAGLMDEEVGLSVPVEAYEHYEDWLVTIAEKAGMPRFRLLDEPSAAALGYGAHIQPGNVYMVFDFGGGTMHASVILIEDEEKSAIGRRCRVLGKAGRDIGGTTIDQWLFQDILRRNRLFDGDPAVRRLSTALLLECQRMKEALSSQDSACLQLNPPPSPFDLQAEYTQAGFEELLDEHGFFTTINQLVRAALNLAAERGYKDDDIQAVLMVGGSCQIPSVQRLLRQFFGKERVLYSHPLDAVARGAAAFVAGVDFYDHIQHDYAIRYFNRQNMQYEYKVVVARGTSYPTVEPISRLNVKASHHGQQKLGIAIFELGEQRPRAEASLELVFDPSGAARITQLTPHEQEQRTRFWMNEHNPTFLTAGHPLAQGEACFDVEFKIDYNKRLTITARDVQTGQLALQDHPVVRLT